MTVKKIAILSPGDMGHAVGRALSDHGFNVLTFLEGRSERTRALAQDAGFRISTSLNELIIEADLVLSILVPAHAEAVAKEIAQALEETGKPTLIADCNAISPMRSEYIGRIVESAGGRYIDASIIGHPPGRDVTPRFYVSGSYANAMLSSSKPNRSFSARRSMAPVMFASTLHHAQPRLQGRLQHLWR